MDNPAIGLSFVAIIFSIIALSSQIALLFFRLDVFITDIIPSTTNEGGFSTFLVRLVIANRASVGRTVCGIKLELPKKRQKVDSIEPILPQYKLSGQNVISVTDYAMTIDDKVKSLGDSVFQPPLDIFPGRSTRQWIALKVSQKYLLQQDGNIRGQLALLNAREGVLGKTDVILPMNFLAGHVQVN
jgi:hypothetical protein